jgi:hypothetical protein
MITSQNRPHNQISKAASMSLLPSMAEQRPASLVMGAWSLVIQKVAGANRLEVARKGCRISATARKPQPCQIGTYCELDAFRSHLTRLGAIFRKSFCPLLLRHFVSTWHKACVSSVRSAKLAAKCGDAVAIAGRSLGRPPHLRNTTPSIISGPK